MSYEVERSMWHFFVPGTRVDPSTPEGAAYVKWSHKHKHLVQLIIQAIASEANALAPDIDSTTRGRALAWLSVPVIADRIKLSERQTQRNLHRMHNAGDLEIAPCDGIQCFPRHQGNSRTNHIYLFQPDDDPYQWGVPDIRKARATRRAARQAQREKQQTATNQKQKQKQNRSDRSDRSK